MAGDRVPIGAYLMLRIGPQRVIFRPSGSRQCMIDLHQEAEVGTAKMVMRGLDPRIQGIAGSCPAMTR
jgi:hypothetical protein